MAPFPARGALAAHAVQGHFITFHARVQKRPAGTCPWAKDILHTDPPQLYQHTDKMERPFESRTLGTGHGRFAVPTQITVPFAVFWVAEHFFTVTQSGIKYLKVFFIFQVAVQHHGSDQQFCMRPPQLHIMLISFSRQALAVDKIKKASVLFVPAFFKCLIEYILRQCVQFFIRGIICLFHHKPRTLDIMPGVHHPPGSVFHLRFPIGAYIL